MLYLLPRKDFACSVTSPVRLLISSKPPRFSQRSWRTGLLPFSCCWDHVVLRCQCQGIVLVDRFWYYHGASGFQRSARVVHSAITSMVLFANLVVPGFSWNRAQKAPSRYSAFRCCSGCATPHHARRVDLGPSKNACLALKGRLQSAFRSHPPTYPSLSELFHYVCRCYETAG